MAVREGTEESWLTWYGTVDIIVVQATDVVSHTESERCLAVIQSVYIGHDDRALEQILRQLEQVHADVGSQADGDNNRVLARREAIGEEG